MYRYDMKRAMSDLVLILDDPHDLTTRTPADASDALKSQEIQRLLSLCGLEYDHISIAINKLTEARQQWVETIKKMTSSARTAAETDLLEFEQSLGLDNIDKARKHQRQLERTQHGLQKEKDRLDLNLGQQQAIQKSEPDIQNHAPRINLPAIRLEKYTGNPTEWPEFFETFSAAVHDANIPKIQKMSYLRTLLAGEARRIIEGLALTEDNYEIAIDLLKDRYENKAEIIRKLMRDLSKLKPCNTLRDCKEFSIKLDCVCRQLEALGESTDMKYIEQSLEEKLPRSVLREIYREKKSIPTWDTTVFRDTLRRIVAEEEVFQEVANVHHSSPRPPRPQGSFPQRNERARFVPHVSNMAFAAPEKFPSCPKKLFQHGSSSHNANRKRDVRCQLCGNGHELEECRRFPTIESKLKTIKEKQLCFKCIGGGHASRQCTSKIKCRHCEKWHNSALCAEKYGEKREADVSTTTTLPSTNNRKVLLMTASAILQNPANPSRTREVIIFFDTGSHRSFITTNVVDWLKLRTHEEGTINLCTFGSQKPKEYRNRATTARILAKAGRTLDVNFNVVDSIIPTAIPMAILEDRKGCHLRNGDVEEAISERKPDILIGIDQLHAFKITAQAYLKNGYVISDSLLGPIISGSASEEGSQTEFASTCLITVSIENNKAKQDENLFDLVQEHYDEQKVIETFNKTLKLVDGRYEVTLPWKTPMPKLNSNYGLARGRLSSTMKLLHQKPDLLTQYHNTMKDQLQKGIIEKVPKEEVHTGTLMHYLPHQPVIRADKLHTKLRIVYDGSAKTGKNGLSINQCLHRGPLLLCDLIGIILRFRIPRICITADIEKAFLQLAIAPTDRDACRFLWPKDPQDENWERNIDTYRFRRVTFGLICSPFLLAAAVKEHLRREGSTLASNIMENIYVDNVVIHAESEEETAKLCKQAKDIFAKAAMNLREFASNDRKSLDQIPEEDKMPTKEIKILGIKWDTEQDKFKIQVEQDETEHPTKRTVLKKVASIFDPMGWLTPALLNAKQFFQSLWKLKLQWDTPLPQALRNDWKEITAKWQGEILIPRRIHYGEKEKFELHVFSDASKDAFGAAAYIRTITTTAEPQSQLIFAKSRIKSVNSAATIPKLELQGLKLAAQMAKFLSQQMQIRKTQLWTDSQCVIHWLNTTSKLERFVENRVKIIRAFNVKYARTEDNPADLVTRGTTCKELEKCDLWWAGPPWLRQSTDYAAKLTYDPAEYSQRINKEQIFYSMCPAAQQPVAQPHTVVSLRAYTTWEKATRVTAYVLRAIEKMRKGKKRDKNLEAKELGKARQLLLREGQMREPPTDEIKKTLEMFQDEIGLWRCKGRLGNSNLPEETKEPIWLPYKDRITELIIIDAHEKTFHAGTATTLSYIRQRYWITQGRKRTKSVITV